MYWIDYVGRRRIFEESDLDGSNRRVIDNYIAYTTKYLTDVVLYGGNLYWLTIGTEEEFYYINIEAGFDVSHVITTPFHTSYGMTVIHRDECSSGKSCENGGTCKFDGSDFVCQCPPFYSGPHCEIARGMCFAEVYLGYTFPDTNVGETVGSVEECDKSKVNFGLPLASRAFDGDRLSTALWHPALGYADCGPDAPVEVLLERIVLVNVTEDNVEYVSAEVAEVTSKTEEISVEALTLIDEIVQKVVSIGSNSTMVTSSLVQIVDNLFSINEDVLIESQVINQAPTSVVQSLEEQLTQVALEDDIYQESTQNLAVLGQKLNVADVNVTGLSFGSMRSVESNVITLEGDSIPIDVTVSIDLPPSTSTIISNATESRDFRVVVIVYNNSKLFQSPQFDSSTRRPNGQVISFSVPGLEPVTLDDPLITTFIPPEISKENNNTACVFWDFELLDGVGGWSSKGCILINGLADGSDRQYCLCNHLTNFAVLMDFYPHDENTASDVITRIGLSLSIAGLCLTLLTIATNKKLQKKKPNKILCNLCVSLLSLYIVFLAGIEQVDSESGCIAVGALLHYFLLSSIFWMSVQALNMYLLFVKVYATHVTKFLMKTCLFAWGTPAVIVLATIFTDVDNYVDGVQHCFLTLKRMYISVAIPVAAALLFNMIMFILVLHSLSQHRKFANQQQKKNEGTRMLQNGISISLIMGLTWLFGFLAIRDASTIMNMVFCVFNSLQGFLIFMLYCVRNKEVRDHWKQMLSKGSGRQNSMQSSTHNQGQPTQSTSHNQGLSMGTTNSGYN